MATKKKSNKIEFPEYVEPVDNSVYAKLERGDYKNKKEYVRFSENPDVYDVYRKEENRILNQFKNDCFVELKLLEFSADKSTVLFKHSKAELLYSKAWEHGHSAGLSEVWTVMQDLVDLIK